MNNYFNENWDELETILYEIRNLVKTFKSLNACAIELPQFIDPAGWTAPISMLEHYVHETQNWLEKGLKEARAQESEVA